MFSVTIISSICSIVISVLILIALRINKDSSESTSWMKKAVLINLATLLIVLITYALCNVYAEFNGDLSTAQFRILYALRDIADLGFLPACIALIEFLRATVNNAPAIAEIVSTIRKVLLIAGFVLVALIGSFLVLRIFGIESLLMENIVYSLELIIAYASLALIAVVAYYARKDLGRSRWICVIVFVVVEIIALITLWITDENIFFAMNACLLLFLFLAMQTERINMSNVNSVIQALTRTEELNAQLESSMNALAREQFLLLELSDIYESMHLINLKNNTYRQLGTPPPKATRIITGILAKAGNQKLIWAIMRRVTDPAYTEAAIEFTDFSTLSDRMRGRKIISLEAIDDEDQWFRFSFIRVGNQLDDDLYEVIYTSENIDRDMREKEHLRKISTTDELTKLHNRNAYVALSDGYGDQTLPEDLWIMVVDINGLKFANDSFGHEAGDELIIGTASCLSEVFAPFGTIYRVGGDEFIVVANAGKEDFNAALQRLDILQSSWSGELIQSLHFSKGIVNAGDFPDKNFVDLAKEADARMYANKRAFYSKHVEMDRRQR